MSNNDKDKLLDHEYDGIRELDNPLPGWWLNGFYLTIIFAIGYFAYYQFMGGPTLTDELKSHMEQIKASQPAPTQGASPSAEVLAAVEKDPAKIASGKEIFDAKCIACHAAGGAGSIGPNLSDAFWINGDGKIESIFKIVKEGVPAKGMPPWAAILKDEEVLSVTAYIRSLKGTKPANPKAPQGNEIKE